MKLMPWLLLTKTFMYDVTAFRGAMHNVAGQASLINGVHRSNRLFVTTSKTSSSVRDFKDVPTNGYIPSTDFVSTENSGKLFRSLMLQDVNGRSIRLGDKMSDLSIVVFLRHLGWFYCWAYANDWCKFQQSDDFQSIEYRPLFVSIGDSDKLRKFLELNPAVPSDRIFVDDYKTLDAYKSLKFPNFTDLKVNDAKGMKLRFPKLSFADSWKYMTNVASISPVDNVSSGLPESVLKNGGTFVIQNDEVIFQWFDKVPGDYPNPSDVLAVAKQAQNT